MNDHDFIDPEEQKSNAPKRVGFGANHTIWLRTGDTCRRAEGDTPPHALVDNMHSHLREYDQ